MALGLIIFDCDGVILESVDAKTRAFARVSRVYGQEVSDSLVRYHQEHGGLPRTDKFTWMFHELLQREGTPEEYERLGKEFIEYSLDEVLRCQHVPGVATVLEQWKGRVPMYVASGAPHGELGQVLKQHGLAGYFDGIYGAPPGKTDLLRRIFAETGIHPSDAIMIGDSSTDQYAAEATKTRFYGRGEGFSAFGYPCHGDLTKLNAHLEELWQEGAPD